MAAEQDRWHAGVIPYAQMGYYAPDYAPKDTDVLTGLRPSPAEPCVFWLMLGMSAPAGA